MWKQFKEAFAESTWGEIIGDAIVIVAAGFGFWGATVIGYAVVGQ